MKLKETLSKKLKKSGGFTLIEMLIVVAIIAILVAVSVPMVNANLDEARKATDAANLRAAKTVAMLSAVEGKLNGDGTAPDHTKTYWYNVETGKLVDTTTAPSKTDNASSYGQSTEFGNVYINVEFAEDTLEPTVQWGPIT